MIRGSLFQLKFSKWFLFLLSATSCLLFFFESPTDLEDYVSFLSGSEVFRRAFLEFKILSWTDLYAIGSPFPFSPNLTRHPLFFALLRLDIFVILRAVLFLHFIVGFLAWLKIFERFEAPPHTKILVLTAFYSGLPLQNYLYTDFWPSIGVCYLLLPLLFHLLLSLAESLWSPILFGGTCGLLFLVGHQGYVVVLVFGLAVVSLGTGGSIKGLLRAGTVASLVFLIVASSQIYELLLTHLNFPPSTVKVVQPPRPSVGQLLSLLLGPASAFSPSFPDYSRYLFFGPATLILFLRAKEKGSGAALPILFFSLIFIFFLPLETVLPIIPSRYFLRDIILVVGLVALCHDRKRSGFGKYLLVAQAIYIFAMFLYGVYTIDPFKTLPPSARLMNGKSAEIAEIQEIYAKDPGLVAFSHNFYHFTSHFGGKGFGNGRLQTHGIRALNHLYAKGVSWEGVIPSPFRFYGTLPTHPSFLSNTLALRFLRVKYILANPAEELVLPDFVEARASKNFRLLRRSNDNFEAFAFGVDPNSFIRRKEPCEYPILNCLDLDTLDSTRSKGVLVDWSQSGDQISVNNVRSDFYPVFVLLPILYSDRWKTSESALSVMPFNNSLVLVKIDKSLKAPALIRHSDRLQTLLYIVSSFAAAVVFSLSIHFVLKRPKNSPATE